MSALLDAALGYAARRLPVFPCQPRGKEPAIKRGFHAATTNPETIRRYWRIADQNIGIPTGSVSGFWVLDIDGDDGEATLRELEAGRGALPPTRAVITGGGRHLWFKYTEPIPSTADTRLGAGLHTRGDGGYVVVPPSVHQNGRRYAWSSPDELSVAPEWLVRLARAKPRSISERALAGIRRSGDFTRHPDAYGSAALEREIDALAATAAGGRNHALNRTSFRLFQLVAGGELDRNLVIDRLIDASRRNGLVKDDGLSSVKATIASGMGAGLKHPRARGVS
jgi:hypothetical protein